MHEVIELHCTVMLDVIMLLVHIHAHTPDYLYIINIQLKISRRPILEMSLNDVYIIRHHSISSFHLTLVFFLAFCISF